MLSFFHATATTEIYTLSLHDALPILAGLERSPERVWKHRARQPGQMFDPSATQTITSLPRIRDRSLRMRCCRAALSDRKSTRLNSSHTVISYAVFCLKKKKDQYENAP